jgi:hypothetical protein
MEHCDLASQADSEDWVKVDALQHPAGIDRSSAIAGPRQCDDATDNSMHLYLRPLSEAVNLEEPSRVLGMASIRAPGIGSTPRLPQLDIVAVIDRSGSMSGLRIEIVKKALRFISKQLRHGDRLALVSYADRASVDISLTLMDEAGQTQFVQALDNLRPGGCTNLGEGLLWGLGELASSDAPTAALLLFTDGLANRGMTNIDELVEAVRGPLSDMGRLSRAVFTFGFGKDHNAQMLFSLSDEGTGCYYYVDTEQAIAPSFADCLGGMLSVAAQDVSLMLHAGDGVSITSIHADFNVALSNDKREAWIKMRDLSSDAEKEVLFDLSVPATTTVDHLTVLKCTLNYVDVADGTTRNQESHLALRGLWVGEDNADVDVIVEMHRCRLLAARAMEQAAAMTGKASTSNIQDILSETLDVLEKSPARTSADAKVQDRISGLIADLSLCLECASDPRSCEKVCSSRAFAHKHQVSTRAEGSEYRNSLQQSLAEAAVQELGSESIQEVARPLFASRKAGRGRFQPPTRVSENLSNPASLPTGTILAGAVRIGMRIMCRGQPGVVQDVTLSKTGKHGHAKAFFTVVGDDGIKRQDILPSYHDVELAPDASAVSSC